MQVLASSQPTWAMQRADNYRRFFIIALLFYIVAQVPSFRALWGGTHEFGTDNAMRLLSVRDLLNGQSWFDMTQHRVLPPEGLSLHWSRLVDAPIAGLELLFRLFLSPAGAELAAAFVWPALVFTAFLALTGHVARARFGNTAAVVSMLVAPVLPVISGTYFGAGQVDHHNVQMLMMLIVTAGLLLQGRPVAMGLAAGVAAAFSFAVGLEMILFIAAAGLILTAQFVLNAAEADRKLPAFGLGLGLAAPVFFAVQTNPALWLAPKCDALSPTFLAVSTVAGLFSLSLGLGGRRLGRNGRIGMALGLGAVALAALAPVLAPCRAGPYAALPAEVLDQVMNKIVEVLPVQAMLMDSPGLWIRLTLAVYIVFPAALVLVARDAINRTWTAEGRDLASVLVFLALGALCAAYQMRTLVMALAVLPLAFGTVCDRLFKTRWQRFSQMRAILLALLVMAGMLSQPLAVTAVLAQQAIKETPSGGGIHVMDQDCGGRDQIEALARIPAAIIATPMNMGPGVLFFSDHSVTAAPYHRSAAAMSNGYIAFTGTEGQMRSMVATTKAAYVLVCGGETYGTEGSIASALARGEAPDWLAPVDLGPSVKLRLFRVLSAGT
jgi:hypothetical protein